MHGDDLNLEIKEPAKADNCKSKMKYWNFEIRMRVMHRETEHTVPDVQKIT